MSNSEARALLARQLKAHLVNPEFPLSFPQQRPWFLDQLQKDNPVYNLPLGYRVKGVLDVGALRFALDEVVRRHEVLRSNFRTIDGVPKQITMPASCSDFEEIDLRSHSEPGEEARRISEEEALLPFNLASGSMLRARLVRLGPDDSLFLLSLHHIACDAWSVGIIAREVSAIYAAQLEGRPHSLPPLKLQYVDFTEWQTRQMKGPARQELMGYWREKLANIPSCINLPTDRPRPPIQDYRGSHVAFDLPADIVSAGVDALARKTGATPFAVLLAAFAALLNRYTGDDQVVIGTPVANRNLSELEQVVGFFTNTLVFRPDLSGEPNMELLVSRVGAETRDALAHQDLPFEIVVEELRPDRDTAHSPVFQVMFIYWDGDDDAIWTLPGCSMVAQPGDSRTAKFDLTLSLARVDNQVKARLEYSTAIFDKETVERFAAQYVTLLRNALEQPHVSLGLLSVLPDSQAKVLWDSWAHGEFASISELLVHESIEHQAAATPNAIAVVDGSAQLTYQELNSRASDLAAQLSSLGVGRGSVVGVYLDRSVATVTALLGILKSGAAYLPLDPAYPFERLAFMREDSDARVVVSCRSLAREASGLGATVICVDERLPVASSRPIAGSPGDLAYLIYTSGSTGKPKGVMLTHRNVATFFAAMNKKFGDDGPGTWLAVTSISFDISVLELLWTLTRGFKVIIRGEETLAGSVGSGSTNEDRAVSARATEFSLFYFGNAPADHASAGNRYRLVMEGARFADANGFSAIWTPERHFHPFGGLFPNPSVLGAAIASITERVGVRAGSVVLPLHDPLRVAEEWSVVDNLSAGRVGISFASGWQPDDFVLAPEKYVERKDQMLRMISEVRKLWRGEKVRRMNGAGAEVEVGVYPRPVQAELPIWITSARHPETFRMAGEAGARLLTHMVGHSAEQLAEKIAIYRSAWREHGWPGQGHVTLMLHTFVHPDMDVVRATVREPLREYIRSSFDLMAGLGSAMQVDLRQLPPEEVEGLLDGAFERFIATSGLLGTPDMVADSVGRLAQIGVDEIGCLIDFGVAEETTLASLPHLATARKIIEAREMARQTAPDPLHEQLAKYRVTHLQCTPSLAGMLVTDPASREALKPLKRFLVGGEALPPELASALADAVSGGVHNMYGPTEVTVWATTSQVEPGQAVRIGKPLPGYEAYVVDSKLNLAPIGVPGELLLGGDAVAKGYHNRPELTEERFIKNPFPGRTGRLYRTGDLVRWRQSGDIEFLGRLDHQVKLRGRRIELGEIEAALVTHPDIHAAVADVRGRAEARGIVAYCVPASEATRIPAPDVLRSFLARTLPDHMLPSAYVCLTALPLTPNGKVNRKALPDVEHARPDLSVAFEAPNGSVEESIAAVWRKVLGIPQVGVKDNFFELGGNSILAVAVRSQLLAKVDPDLSLIDMFRYPTVGSLAAAIEGRRAEFVLPSETATAAMDAAERRRAALSRKGQARGQEAKR